MITNEQIKKIAAKVAKNIANRVEISSPKNSENGELSVTIGFSDDYMNGVADTIEAFANALKECSDENRL